MKKIFLVSIAMGCPLLNGCTIISVGAYSHPPRVQMDGWVTAYAAAKGIRSWDGNIVNLNILKHHEVISAEVWPLAEAGIGVIGARLQILPAEVAVGTLFYHPTPEDYWFWRRRGAEPEKDQEKKDTGEPAP